MGLNSRARKAELERRRWLEGMVRYMRPGKIVEFGCGSGFVLQTLSENFPESLILGLDLSRERLEKVNERGLKNVLAVYGDATENIFPNESFDTAIFVSCLHEIYSFMGRRRVNRALKTAFQVLRRGGVLVVEDFLKPRPRKVELSFKNERTRRRFLKFASEFQPRTIEFSSTPPGAKLDIADAVEFISKYGSPNWRDWKEEMRETHFFFTLKEYREALQKTGFLIEDVKELPRSQERWEETREDIGFAYEPEYKWVMVIARKPILERRGVGQP